jgi:glycyl-tRNA synthetase beta chain
MLPSDGDFSLIRKGYERVLSARLNDALFFYRNDRKVHLKDQAEKLKRIVYFEKLGTLYDKTERITAIALYLGELLNITAREEIEREDIKQEDIKLAAGIAKADLASEMVFELPELQGTMGRYYALHQGYSEKVALAVEEHYLPRYAGGALPQTPIGGVLAVADRIDTIAAAFSVGMIPSGSLDPYGLRRAAIGIINILDGFSWRIGLKGLVGFALERVNNNTAETAAAIIEYILSRQKQILAQSGVSGEVYDTAAALKDDLIDIRIRAEIIAREKENAKFASVTASYKRINNILKKAETLPLEYAEANTSLFESDEERILFDIYEKRSAAIKTLTSQREWAKTLYELEAFAEPLNAYFVSVMIMNENPLIRANRLLTLSKLKQLFNSTGLT